MEKDHKQRVEGKEWPESRQVCGANTSINSRLSDQVSEFLEIVKESLNSGTECTSTEDLQAAMEELARRKEAEASILGKAHLGNMVGMGRCKA